MHRPLDPRIVNITLDANALDRKGGAGDALVDRVLSLQETGKINFVVPGSVRIEVQHPRTPGHVKAAVLPQIHSLPVGRTAGEEDMLRKIRALLRGNAAAGKHDADGLHLFEAAKYGGGYFITHDDRMLRKRDDLRALLGPTLKIMTLADFLDIYDEYEAGRRL